MNGLFISNARQAERRQLHGTLWGVFQVRREGLRCLFGRVVGCEVMGVSGPIRSLIQVAKRFPNNKLARVDQVKEGSIASWLFARTRIDGTLVAV